MSCVKSGISTGWVLKSYNNDDDDVRETPNHDDWKIRNFELCWIVRKANVIKMSKRKKNKSVLICWKLDVLFRALSNDARRLLLVFVSSSIDPPCHFLWWIRTCCELPLRHKLLSPTPVFLCICLSSRLLHIRSKVILGLSLHSPQFTWGTTAHCYFSLYGRHAYLM